MVLVFFWPPKKGIGLAKSLGKPNHLLTSCSKSDSELRDWGGRFPWGQGRGTIRPNPNVTTSNNCLHGSRRRGSSDCHFAQMNTNCLHEGPGRYISGPFHHNLKQHSCLSRSSGCWMDRWVGGWMDGRMDGWMDGWVDGWVGGWRGGWVGG